MAKGEASSDGTRSEQTLNCHLLEIGVMAKIGLTALINISTATSIPKWHGGTDGDCLIHSRASKKWNATCLWILACLTAASPTPNGLDK